MGISVLMSIYKKEKPEYFRETMESILAQTRQPEEIVLIEDGTLTPELDAVIEEYQKRCSNLKVYPHKENQMLGRALAEGVTLCSYELIARMDTDDISKPNRCEKQLQAFDDDDSLDIVGGNINEFIGDVNNVVSKRNVPKNNGDIKEYMKKRCAFNHMTVMFKKSSVEDAGGYLDLFWNEDYYLWIRMWMNGAVFANTGTALVDVRVGNEMYQRRGGSKYFASEKKLQNYMLEHQMISFPTYFVNLSKRFIIQKLMPGKLRGWVFRKFARA